MEGMRLLKGIRESRFSVIPSAKHLPFQEDEKYFNMLVKEFLTGKILEDFVIIYSFSIY